MSINSEYPYGKAVKIRREEDLPIEQGHSSSTSQAHPYVTTLTNDEIRERAMAKYSSPHAKPETIISLQQKTPAPSGFLAGVLEKFFGRS